MFSAKVKLCANIVVLLVVLKTYYVKSSHEKKPGLMYMLLWSALDTEPFKYISPKRNTLKSANCKFQNCYVVREREYFQDVTDYDAILFTVKGLRNDDLPLARADNQLYVFVSQESPTYFPFHEEWNWFFNYTWTYKLNSDVVHPYFIVRNKRGVAVAPKINARWRNSTRMRPIEQSIIDKLENKTNAAAWFVTNCEGNVQRLSYGHSLNRALNKYNLNVDIYGQCGDKNCPKGHFNECMKIIQSHYYFYLAFENSNHEDYVTEKLFTALNYYAVPVVLGGANYSRFIPDGFYINGNILSEEEVAEKINGAIQDKQKYYDYFKWHRYYTYGFTDERDDTHPLCSFCALLNDESKRNQRRVYAQFDKWWNDSENKTQDIIVQYDESAPHIKSFLTYRAQKVNKKTVDNQSVMDKVNDLVDDLINYYFS